MPTRLSPSTRILAGLLLTLLLACGDGGGEPSATASAASAAEPAVAEGRAGTTGAETQPAAAAPRRNERPLPAFSGRTLEGKPLSVSSLIGKRLVLFFFNPEVPGAAVVARAVRRIADERGEHNFEIAGVAMASTPERARAFVKEQGLDFTVFDDSRALISQRIGLRAPVAMLGVDAEGYVIFGMGQFATDTPDATDQIEQQIRQALRLPEDEDAPGTRPEAPLFEATLMGGDETFRLADHRGQPVVLVFFLHTCPHCHEFLEFMKEQLAQMPEASRPVLVGIEVTGKTYAVRESMQQEGLGFFPVAFDDDGSIRSAYGVFAGVPDIVLIDAEGRIASRVRGWRPEIDGPLLRMRMAKLGGGPVPMLLRTAGFSGNEACGVCHEAEHATWRITQHATAYDTLVKHGVDADPECVSCHVVGFGQEGGFDIAQRVPELEDVGCESCHGRGGPHLSPNFVTKSNYEPACVGCHDTKHSLGFEYGKFLPQISHAENAKILALPEAERDAILEARGAVRTDLLPTTADYVGSEACRSCHASEYATWAANPHAHAVETLQAKGEASNADCLACHTTGFGKAGGFPSDAAVADHADLARVGCESCHGPGGSHVQEGVDKLGSIVSLGDKCDSCVILQICGSCHDDANDPGFEFEVQDKIDAIRHGTIEAGTGAPLEPGGKAGKAARGASLPAMLSDAFALADRTPPASNLR